MSSYRLRKFYIYTQKYAFSFDMSHWYVLELEVHGFSKGLLPHDLEAFRQTEYNKVLYNIENMKASITLSLLFICHFKRAWKNGRLEWNIFSKSTLTLISVKTTVVNQILLHQTQTKPYCSKFPNIGHLIFNNNFFNLVTVMITHFKNGLRNLDTPAPFLVFHLLRSQRDLLMW